MADGDWDWAEEDAPPAPAAGGGEWDWAVETSPAVDESQIETVKGPGTDTIPEGMRETGSRVLQLPEQDITVDPRGPVDATGHLPTTVRQRGEFTELRQVAPINEGLHDRLVRRTGDVGAYGAIGEELRGFLSRIDPGVVTETVMRGPWAGRAEELAAGGAAVPLTAARALGEAMPSVSQSAPVQSIGRAAGSTLEALGLPPPQARGSVGETYEANRRMLEGRTAAQEAQNPESVGVGELAYAAPSMLVGNPAGSFGRRLATWAGIGGGGAGMRGLAESDADDVEGLLSDAGQDALLGAGAAMGGEALGTGVSAGARALARAGERLRLPAARMRNAAAGIRYAPETDLIDDPIRTAEILRETGISSGMQSTRSSGERAAQVRGEANATITRLLQQANEAAEAAPEAGYRAVRGDAVPGTVRIEDLTSRLSALRDRIGGQGAPQVGARNQIDDMIRRYTEAHPEGAVPIDDIADDWRAFGDPANFRDGQPWNTLGRSRRGLRSEFRNLMEGAMESASGPESRGELAGALERVHAARTAERGAERVQRRNSGNRVLSLTDYITGAGGLGGAGVFAGAGDPVTAGGVALGAIALNRLARPREHAIGALVLEGLSNRFRALGTPQAARWGQILDAAQQRGQAALAAAHYTMSRQDPDYRQAVEAMQEEEGQ